MMLKILSLALLVAGLSVSGGCSLIKEVATMPTAYTSSCHPIIPALPSVNEKNEVVLQVKDQESLLIYFLEVERCGAEVWTL